MDKQTKLWLKAMEISRKYWGCHQIPERSCFIHGYQFPVCCRCMGIWLGSILAALLWLFNIIIPIYITLVFLFPMIIDGILQYKLTIMSTNARRILTGLLFGIGYWQSLLNIISIIAK